MDFSQLMETKKRYSQVDKIMSEVLKINEEQVEDVENIEKEMIFSLSAEMMEIVNKALE